MRNHIQVDVLPYHLHALKKVGGDRTDDDTVVILVERLHLGQVALDGLVFLGTQVGEKDGFLDAETSHALKILHHVVSHLVALYVIHYEKKHVAVDYSFLVHYAKDEVHPLLQRG